jgi:site-specific recombinase XerD
MQGVPLAVIGKILGHSSTQVTEIYSHVSEDVVGKAMDEVFGNG